MNSKYVNQTLFKLLKGYLGLRAEPVTDEDVQYWKERDEYESYERVIILMARQLDRIMLTWNAREVEYKKRLKELEKK